ncbi:MAG: HNH endonuclease [Lachnospiraceae bacterium]|nr:HNH endonuclease [Lachnospiraceae bacterium]
MGVKKLSKRLISFTLALIMLVNLAGCSFKNDGASDSGVVPADNDTIVVNDVAINDSFVTLEIKGLEEAGITVDDIDIDEILVHCIEVKGIDSIEVEVTSINDEFVYLAYKNFVSYYGDDFDLKDFLIDAGIGCGCILICVTLSVAGGPVGTFFGAVITSQFTTSAIVIGAAIDAAVSAYQAYEEGGDASYIIGHMLNGVADGFKWSAMLAPLTGAVDGIKALRAVSALRKVPGFEDVTDKEARKIFETLADIVSRSGQSADNLTDDALRELYKSLPKEVTEEISEDFLRNILTNRALITDIVRKFNPFNVSKEVLQAMQDNFLRRAGLADDAGKELIKQIKNGTIKNLDEIADPAVREFIEKNMYEFVECFGSSLSKDFIDGCLKSSLGDDAFNLIKNSITSDNLYLDLVKTVGRDTADDVLSDTNTLILLQLRYGSKNVNKLINVHVLYEQMLRNNNIPDEQLEKVIAGIMDGSLKSLDDISDISAQIAKNLTSSREVTAQVIKNLGNGNALSGLLDDLAKAGMESIGVPADCAADIISNSLTKTEIISKYGDDVYRTLLSDYNFNLTLNCLAAQNTVNSSLVREMTTDALSSRGLTDDIIENILSGRGITEWGIADDEIMAISNVVADYYRMTDSTIYANYVMEISEKRGEVIADFLVDYKNAGNTITNINYAGSIMEPHANSNPAYIKSKYGNIYMSSQGFPVFDDYAIARIELPDLVGDDGVDIARANLIHHGTQSSIPGYTWHHLEDGKTLILIPSDLHEAYRHTGGASLIREGL